jgi:cytochrome c
MKKVFALLIISAALSACGGGSKSGSADSTATAPADSASATTATAETPISTTDPGAKLMVASDCFTCHKIDTKVIGPSYKDVAAKYPDTEASIDTLANKVIKGGSGNWGTVPMAPHPTVSLADAKLMVKYVLSLKK